VHSNEFNLTLPASEQTAKVYSVKKVIPHPKYDPATNQYDIAILKLNVTGYTSQPNIDLDSGSLGNDVGLNVTAIGWGQLYSNGPTAVELQEVQIPIMSDDECKINNDLAPIDMDIEFCAGPSDGGKGVCHGDSGGPVGVFRYNKFTLIGTTDWGHNPPCAPPKYGAVFVRVSAFVDWIKSLAD
jgi:trypsin